MDSSLQPVYFIAGDVKKSVGKDALRENIKAAVLVSEILGSTLGPRGMEKMIVKGDDISITGDGMTILNEIGMEHHSAKLIVEIANTMKQTVGDGATTAIVLAGSLLKNAEKLLEKGLHPTEISRGFRLASIKAVEILDDIAEKLSYDDKTLKNIAITAMKGRNKDAFEPLSGIIVDAIKAATEKRDGAVFLSRDDIILKRSESGKMGQTELIEGVILDKELFKGISTQPLKNAKILLLSSPIENSNTSNKTNMKITHPNQIHALMVKEQNMSKDIADKIAGSGANAVFCRKKISDSIANDLSKRGICTAADIKEQDMAAISRATGARMLDNADELGQEDLGLAGLVEQVKEGGKKITFLRECKNHKFVTIWIRGSSTQVTQEIERLAKDAIADIALSVQESKVVAGGGAAEMEAAKEVRKFSTTLKGKVQIAVNSFADSIESIPVTLAENSGFNGMDIITELRSSHERKKIWAGFDASSGKVVDAWEKGLIEPLGLKTEAIESAVDAAVMILRIDEVMRR